MFEASIQYLLFSSALIGITQSNMIISSDHHSCEQNGWMTRGGSVTAQGMWDGLIHGTCNVAL